MRTFLFTKEALTLKRKRNKKKTDIVFRRRYLATFLPIFSQFRRKTRVNELKMFTLLCNFLFNIEKKTKNLFWDFYDLGVKNPLMCQDLMMHWQMSVWVSLKQQWIMTTWNKQTPTILARKPFAVLLFEKRKHPTRTTNRFVISFT